MKLEKLGKVYRREALKPYTKPVDRDLKALLKSGALLLEMKIMNLILKLHKIILLVLLAFVWSKPLCADIIQTPTLSPIRTSIEQADSNTLVIFDIDDVLLTAKDQILQPTHKSLNNDLAKEIQNRVSKEEAEELWSIIMLTSDSEPVDPSIIPLIQNTQSRGIRVLALTNILTGPLGTISSIEDWNINRLKKNNINLKTSWENIPKKKFINIKSHEHNRYVTFQDGVLFTSGVPKGKALQAFMHFISYKPNRIIFIDDKLLHLESIQSFCKEANIHFTGFQYTAVKDKIQEPFSEERARLQFQILEKKHRWLSDEKADGYLTNGESK